MRSRRLRPAPSSVTTTALSLSRAYRQRYGRLAKHLLPLLGRHWHRTAPIIKNAGILLNASPSRKGDFPGLPHGMPTRADLILDQSNVAGNTSVTDAIQATIFHTRSGSPVSACRPTSALRRPMGIKPGPVPSTWLNKAGCRLLATFRPIAARHAISAMGDERTWAARERVFQMENGTAPWCRAKASQ
jgi:hypothetical protein